jgi:hypothetical protein
MAMSRLPLLLAGLAVTLALGHPVASPAARVNPKRGVASARYLSTSPSALTRLHAAWAYDWSWMAPAATPGLEWVPMIWGPGSLTPPAIRTLTAARRSGRARALLGFNEPDSASQSNVTPARAAALWPQLEVTGLRLGSPAPAVPDDGWLAQFMALARARRLRVDFIALHFYQDFSDPAAVDQLRRELVALHSRYGRPLWVTELGAYDIRSWGLRMLSPPSYPLASAYMRKVLSMLDRLSFVERYAWFTDDCWSTPACRYGSLFDGANHLTARGRIYGSG